MRTKESQHEELGFARDDPDKAGLASQRTFV